MIERASSSRADYRFYDVRIRVVSDDPHVVPGLDSVFGRFAAEEGPCDVELAVSLESSCPRWRETARLEAKVREGYDCANFLVGKRVLSERTRDGCHVFRTDFEASQWDWLGHLECAVFYFVLRNLYGFLQLHAGCVAKGDRAVLLTGRSGAGKTTLTWHLARAGFDYFSDELALVSFATMNAFPFPRNPVIRADTTEVRGEEPPGTLIRSGGIEKRTVSLSSVSVRPWRASARPVALVFPEYDAAAETRILPMARAEAIRRMYDEGSICNLSRDVADCTSAMETIVQMVFQASAYHLVWRDAEAATSLIAGLPELGTEQLAENRLVTESPSEHFLGVCPDSPVTDKCDLLEATP